MRLTTFLLFIVLLSLIGLCSVHEANRRTLARYRLAELQAREKRIGEEIARLKVEIAALTEPERLEEICRQMGQPPVPLHPLPENYAEEMTER